jgi:hypothetical protein
MSKARFCLDYGENGNCASRIGGGLFLKLDRLKIKKRSAGTVKQSSVSLLMPCSSHWGCPGVGMIGAESGSGSWLIGAGHVAGGG